MNVVYFDCFSGASGDMILGALLDAGLDFDFLKEELNKLNISDYEIEANPVKRQGIGGTQFNVQLLQKKKHSHRHLKEIRQLIESSTLSEKIKKDSLAIFTRLAEAEAKVHRTTPEKIHFHEVGAIDAIIDIVGAVIGLQYFGVDRVTCSALTTGFGFVDCEHGRMPVPAPATEELIRGYPSQSGEIDKELLTPTGAAILTTLVSEFGTRPSMKVSSIGYGAGSRELNNQPNLLRVLFGEEKIDPESDRVWIVETNLDDISPETIGYVKEKCFELGALDVYSTPVQMKKSRPAIILSVITANEHLSSIEELILEETTTFGVRRYPVERRKLERKGYEVMTKFGKVHVKLGYVNGHLLKGIPEYEDCRRIASAKNLPLNRIYQAANEKVMEL